MARSDAIQWVDPVIGLRLRHQFTPQQEIMVRGDIGGFGIGQPVRLAGGGRLRLLLAATGYHIAALIGLSRHRRELQPGSGVDTSGINEILYGPIIGVSFRF